MKKWLMVMAIALSTVLVPSLGNAQTSFYTDRAVGVSPFGNGGIASLIPIQYGKVRVCNFPAVGSPCTNPASITDINGQPLTIVGGNFGQLNTDVVGRFSFGCTLGTSYQVQVAASSTNTPALNYPVTCPGAGFSPTFGVITAGTMTASTMSATSQFLGAGTQSVPAFSFTAEPNSGWFRQQAGIFGFSIGSNYLIQYSVSRIGIAPGICLGWAPGSPNSNSNDVNLCRAGVNILTMGAGTLNLGNLIASASVTAKTLNSVQNVATYATGGAGTSVSPWTSASGTGGCQEAVNALGANGGTVMFTEGFYSFTNTTTGCVPVDNVTFDSVGRSAQLNAGANNAVFFLDTTHAFFSRFLNLTLDGNGFTGVKAIDLTNARYGTVIQNVNINNLNQGIVLTNANFGATVKNVAFRAVTAPINVVANNSSVLFDYITIDNENFVPTVACTNGMNFQSGALSNLGPTVLGGFIQGCATGILDQTVGLTVIGTYFEDNTVADISASGAFNPHYIHTNHWGATGPVAIKGRNTTGAKIDNPIMGSGARTGLFDWDATNTNSVAEYILNGSSMNVPVGTTTGLKAGSKILTGDLQLRRPLLTQGTALTTPKIVPNAAMGSTSTVTSIRGTDAAFTVQVNSSGTGQAVNGGFTVTFADGAWSNAPICTVARTDGGSPSGSWFVPFSLSTTTSIVVDLNAVPVAGNSYGVSVICAGSPN